MAGLGGISTSVALDMLEPEPDKRRPPVAISSALGRRFLPVSGSCSVLDRGVVELGRERDALPFDSPVADFQDFRMDLRILPLSGVG